LIGANASKDSVVKSSPELIAAYAAAYEAAEKKLNDPADRPCFQAVNDVAISMTDPDAGLVRKGGQGSQPTYHHHRAVDDAQGVITAVETTSGSIAENKKLMDLVTQHEQNTRCAARTAVADHKYGTAENFVACHQKDIVTHLGDAKAKAGQVAGIFPESAFVYDAQTDQFACPAGQTLLRRRYIKRQHVWEYGAARGICAGCALRAQCTRSQTSRTITRHEHARILEICRAQSHSAAGKRDRQRRQYLTEGSFADAANNHGFKRARWRRLWRQQIQDYLIAAIQNIRILLARTGLRPATDNGVDLKQWMGGRVGLGMETLWLGNAGKMFWRLNRRQPSIFSLN
jgi:transposase